MLPGFHFRRRFKLAPGIVLNISKTGASVSLGPSDFHITTGSHGTWFYMDVPGRGTYYRKKISGKSAQSNTQQQDGSEPIKELPPQERLNLNFLQRVVKSNEELHLVEAALALYEGREMDAYRHARQATGLADGAFLAGILALKHEDNRDAVRFLRLALDSQQDLGKFFAEYELELAIVLPITDEIGTDARPTLRSVLLALSEAYKQLGELDLAIEQLETLRKFDPDDLVLRLSLAELYDARYPDEASMQKHIIEMAGDVHNISPLHANLMYYRGRALRRLGMDVGARDTLTKALRRTKDYPDELLRALRYERALVYEKLGHDKKAKSEFQKIFAEAPDYEDVAAKLGL